MSYFLAFLGLAVLITLHEAGHFAAAKAVGMRVERFSLFFGPMLVKWVRGETTYGIGVIPLGGYVKITGMSPTEEFESPEVEARAYLNQPVWKRIVVIAAGPAVNFAIAFLIVWLLFFVSWGPASTTVQSVIPHTPGAAVLKPGDQLVSVDGLRGSAAAMRTQIESHTCLGKQVNGCVAQTPAKVVVDRNGVLHTFYVKPVYSAAYGVGLVGFSFGTHHNAAFATTNAAAGLWRVTSATLSKFAHIFQAKDRKQFHSVVGAYTITQGAIASSATSAWEILALISLSLGLINLFPFLPLDGGHIFWAVAEKIRGRRIPFAVMQRASYVGVALILGLFLIGLSNDISGLAHGTLTAH
jgi:regulator of sigma E protease